MDEKIVNKRLTDEEIVKALKICSKELNSCDKCPVKEHCCDTSNTILLLYALDLIHRLQSENESLKSPKFASWKLKFFRLKEEFDKELAEHEEFAKKANAEIERLTAKYRNLEINYNATWEDYRKYEVENAELQKQVDELKTENTELYKEHTTVIAGSILQKKQAVKDTAKDILQKIMNIIKKSNGFLAEEVIRIMAKQKGVEVE